MELRPFKNPHFYPALIAALILGGFLTKEHLDKQKTSIPLEPATIHRAGPTRVVPVAPPSLEKDPAMFVGVDIFYYTSRYASPYVGAALSCTQCHFNGGRQEGILGLLGVAATYPKYDPRAGRIIHLDERIQSCFLRSENGKTPDHGTLLALNHYITALSKGMTATTAPMNQDFVTIAKNEIIPIEQLNPHIGKELYHLKCASCHSNDGQGDEWAPPLWGPRSFNDGAGLARVYTMASFVHDAMPLGETKKINSVEAQEIAAFINAQERPVFGGKDKDYPQVPIPVDAVYYTKKYPQNPMKVLLEKKDQGGFIP